MHCSRLERAALGIHYVDGNHWMNVNPSLSQTSGGYAFAPLLSDDEQMPRPVNNMVSRASEAEFASLTKSLLKPKVMPKGRDPRVQASAKVAEDVLNNRLEKLKWAQKRDQFTFLNIVTGTVGLESSWEEAASDTLKLFSPDAVKCPNCPTMLNSPEIPESSLGGMEVRHGETIQESSEGNVTIYNCPTCPEPTPMQPMLEGNPESMDYFNRPMGEEVMRGDTAIRVRSIFELFPQNHGLGYLDPSQMSLMGIASIEHLDWIEDHFPEFAGKIDRASRDSLHQKHPLLGTWGMVGLYDSSLDKGVYDCHNIVYTFIQQKSRRFPQGRLITFVGDEMVRDIPLFKKVGENEVPLMEIGVARFKLRPKEFWGRSLVDDLISPQNQLNAMDSMVLDNLYRMGSPNMLIPQGMGEETVAPEYSAEYGAKVIRFPINPLAPNAEPKVLEGPSMPSDLWQQLNAKKDDIIALAGPQDVERGDAPGSVTTTSGIQILEQQAQAQRGHRIRSINEAYQTVWEHQLKLLWTLRIDPDEYEVETQDGVWEVRQFTKESINGQVKVKVEKQPDLDKNIYDQERVQEALATGLYGDPALLSPVAKQRLLELKGLPTDVVEETNYQIQNAKKQWVDFIDHAKLPRINPTMDDPRLRHQTLATLLQHEEGQKLLENLGWNEIYPRIANWEKGLEEIEMAEQLSRATYGYMASPEQAQEQYALRQVQYAEQQANYPQIQQAEQEAIKTSLPGAPPPIATPPPQAPPKPVFLPACIEDKIYAVWQMMLKNSVSVMGPQQIPKSVVSGQISMDPMEFQQEQDRLLKFLSVVEGLRVLADRKDMGLMMKPALPGQPAQVQPVPTPGSPQSAPMGSTQSML